MKFFMSIRLNLNNKFNFKLKIEWFELNFLQKTLFEGENFRKFFKNTLTTSCNTQNSDYLQGNHLRQIFNSLTSFLPMFIWWQTSIWHISSTEKVVPTLHTISILTSTSIRVDFITPLGIGGMNTYQVHCPCLAIWDNVCNAFSLTMSHLSAITMFFHLSLNILFQKLNT